MEKVISRKINTFADSANEALRMYHHVKGYPNSFVLSIGVQAAELILKAIIEEELGFVPIECIKGGTCNGRHFSSHDLAKVAGIAQTHCGEKLAVDSETASLLRYGTIYYKRARYPHTENDGRIYEENVFTNADFDNVSRLVAKMERVWQLYKEAKREEERNDSPFAEFRRVSEMEQ